MRILILLFFCIHLSAQTVYKTPSGAKYHLSSCRMVKNVSSALPLEKAVREGLSFCKICNPPQSPTLGIIGKPKKTAGTNSQNRCSATTKSGTRCKRNTRIGNNFCFLHLPN